MLHIESNPISDTSSDLSKSPEGAPFDDERKENRDFWMNFAKNITATVGRDELGRQKGQELFTRETVLTEPEIDTPKTAKATELYEAYRSEHHSEPEIEQAEPSSKKPSFDPPLPDPVGIQSRFSDSIQALLQRTPAELAGDTSLPRLMKEDGTPRNFAGALSAEIANDCSRNRKDNGQNAFSIAEEFLTACVTTLRSPEQKKFGRHAPDLAGLVNGQFDLVISGLEESVAAQKKKTLNLERPIGWNIKPRLDRPNAINSDRAMDGISQPARTYLGRVEAETAQIISLLKEMRPMVEACANSSAVFEKEDKPTAIAVAKENSITEKSPTPNKKFDALKYVKMWWKWVNAEGENSQAKNTTAKPAAEVSR